jgi:hypothetical protein
MKKLISVLLLGSVFTFGACKKDDKDEAKKEDTATKPADKPADPAAADTKPADPAAADPAKPADPAPAGGAASTGLAECDAYVAAMDKYMTCDKVPQSARDAAKQGLDAMKSGWANMGQMPDDAKKAAGDACKQAVDALKQGAEAMGCTL